MSKEPTRLLTGRLRELKFIATEWIRMSVARPPDVGDAYGRAGADVLRLLGEEVPPRPTRIELPPNVSTVESAPQPKEPRLSYYGDGLQPWDLIKSLGMGAQFAAGNVIKYVGRYDKKNGLDDLRKCRWYLDRLIEIVESASTEGSK